MNVILAAWLDPRMDTFLVETWDGEIDESEIFDYYSKSKGTFGVDIMSKTDDYVAFTDGTRVHLTLHKIKSGFELAKNQIELEELLRIK